MTAQEMKEAQQEGWLRTGLQIATIVFMAGIGWAQLSNFAQRLDKLEQAKAQDVQIVIAQRERLTAIETKLDFLLTQAPRLVEAIPSAPPQQPAPQGRRKP